MISRFLVSVYCFIKIAPHDGTCECLNICSSPVSEADRALKPSHGSILLSA